MTDTKEVLGIAWGRRRYLMAKPKDYRELRRSCCLSFAVLADQNFTLFAISPGTKDEELCEENFSSILGRLPATIRVFRTVRVKVVAAEPPLTGEDATNDAATTGDDGKNFEVFQWDYWSSLGELMKMYYRRRGIPPFQGAFSFKSARVRKYDTPQGLGVKGEEMSIEYSEVS
ncbi:hypothetical protein C8034_v003955 [Colletotrichum sidae]|uniref:Uncharacterized protein n=1 Tax=Colletotrichum sidae TaxID=1347389 RepID=A0A4R8TN26_9PEZI|nr:hypothetical protein C8034_v003955 [Colletotrichum sidae]